MNKSGRTNAVLASVYQTLVGGGRFIKILPGSYGHDKSWNLKMHFPGLEK